MEILWNSLFSEDYWFARFLIQRGLALVYLIGFFVAINQFRPLLGENGLLPATQFLQAVNFREAPSLFHFYYSDRFFSVVAWLGATLAMVALLGLSERGPIWMSVVVWTAMWVLYLSIVNIGQTFYAFGWESLLLEAGFLAIFLGPFKTMAPFLVIILMRWLVFRLEFGAGLIKWRGDPCWRNLTCMMVHHETQPMPNPLSWFFHYLPAWFHRLEVVGNFFVQLVVPWGLFLPQPFAGISGALIIGTQSWLMLSGNYAWLNFITIVLTFSAFNNGCFTRFLPFLQIPQDLIRSSIHEWSTMLLTASVGIMSYWPVRNLLSDRQMMNASFNSYHLVNTYGAFGSVTKERYEIILEGSETAGDPDSIEWKEYQFKGKPGDPFYRPRQFAPYHLRLDWLMWFAAMTPKYNYYQFPWFASLVEKMLEGDAAVLGLLRVNPFVDNPPKQLRARLYHYHYSTPEERKATGAWWHRELVGDYLPPVGL
ncbi:MAG: hypothetical protein COV45_00200 [Deltaproteobacteria bacterium CG11_big_fil_rev_8_21_14_0_20_47_16]|nr:MAG: hypothetical protein COV45_00200 [Deltaproteobacteria bacterium CG11_big_fil_rev_8_21_14_0_20_47_16]